MQGHGLGTILLAHLAEVAEENGIATFVAEVLPQNHRMIEMFRASGFPVEIDASAEGLHVEFPTSLSAEAIAALRGPRPHRGQGGGRGVPRAALDRRRRRLPPSRHGRRRSAAQPDRVRLRGADLPGQPGCRHGAVAAGLPERERDPRRSSTWLCWRSGPRGSPPSHANAPPRAHAGWSCSRPASPRPAPRARRGNASCSASAARRG